MDSPAFPIERRIDTALLNRHLAVLDDRRLAEAAEIRQDEKRRHDHMRRAITSAKTNRRATATPIPSVFA
jgi:hypothetical protein